MEIQTRVYRITDTSRLLLNRRAREESAVLLDLVVSKAERLIRPYCIPILKVLLPKARESNISIASRILSCIGGLARVGGEDLSPHISSIMAIIIETLQDQSSAPRRDAAIRALGSVCSNTAYVIKPLQDFPNLLGVLTRILRGEQNQQMRRETIKVMGILGALDPYLSQVCWRVVLLLVTCSQTLTYKLTVHRRDKPMI